MYVNILKINDCYVVILRNNFTIGTVTKTFIFIFLLIIFIFLLNFGKAYRSTEKFQ